MMDNWTPRAMSKDTAISSPLAAEDAGPLAAEDAGVERVDIRAVNKREERGLYKSREKIFPKLAHGNFRRLKWLAMAGMLAIYYLAPWLRWERGGNLPDQAILIDFPGRRFYFFFIEIWPQEVYYLTGLLILAALGLFLLTSLFGRVWCGYACPQTVWTDLFIAVERLVEGDRGARIRLDHAGWSVGKIGKRILKHAIWLVIAAATGGAWVFYFADAPGLAAGLLRFDAPAASYISIALLTATTYLLGGLAREQVCTYMCPWPRIQAAMLDADSLVVTYRPDRGEPRGPHRKSESWDDRGHCIDCQQCVAVCPMGIDIRDGYQLECISCGLCIDACNDVMDRVGLLRGLIGYDTDANVAARAADQPTRFRLLRPRTVIYALLIVFVGALMLAALTTRATLDVNVLRDRNPLFVTLSDGSIRNGYTVKILNKLYDTRRYALSVEGLPAARLKIIGVDGTAPPALEVAPDRMRSFRVFVAVAGDRLGAASTSLRFVLTDLENGAATSYDSQFRGPKQ